MTSRWEQAGATGDTGREDDGIDDRGGGSWAVGDPAIAERPTLVSSEASPVTPPPIGLKETAVSAGPRRLSPAEEQALVDSRHEGRSADAAAADSSAPVGAATLAATAASIDRRPPSLRRVRDAPARVGRYLILDELGSGGMGAVYAAYDPELDRKIAVKLLRSGHGGPQERARLIREAQAMAKLAHPNVVAVHDVGEHLGEVFVAMEFVKGTTLGGWLAREARSWSAILAIFLQAGEGLRAAHEAGLVHRDFKPDNVLVGADDRARVTDFGLVRAADLGEPPMPAELLVTGEAGRPLALQLTSAGTVMGTPAYMAPEQFLAAETDARTDQFSFCVALHHALCGALPFVGESFTALRESVTAGRRAPVTRRPSAPAWILAAIDRGLARAPDDRWPSMAALLDALRRDPAARRRRGRWVAAAIVGVGLVAAGLVVADRRAEARCVAEGAIAAERVHAAAPAIEAALRGTGLSFADKSWERSEAGLTTWADAWSDARIETCALDRRGDPRAAARVRCLEAGLEELSGALGVLVEIDRAGVIAAIDVVSRLPPPRRCRDDRQVESLYPAEGSGGAPDARARLVRASVLRTAIRQDEATALVRALLEDPIVTAEAPRVRAEALQLDALLRGDAGEAAAEIEALQRAYFYAGAIGHDVLTIDVASDLVGAVLDRTGDTDRAQLWNDLAAMRITRLGLEGTDYDAIRLNDLAAIRIYEGRVDEAIELGRRSLALLEAIRGVDHPSLVNPLYRLSIALDAAGRRREAAALVARALDLMVTLKGEDHPSASRLRGAAANAALEAGDLAGARTLVERAIAGLERAFGPTHPDLVEHLNTLAAIDLEEGDGATALTHLRRALALLEAEDAVDGPQAIVLLTNIGALTLDLGAPADAVEIEGRAIDLVERTGGSDHRDLVEPLTALARALLRLDRIDESLAAARRAVDIGARTIEGPSPPLALARRALAEVYTRRGDHDAALAELDAAKGALGPAEGRGRRRLADLLAQLGAARLAAGDREHGVEELERALTIYADLEGPPSESAALARFDLARALWDAPADRPRALELAARARVEVLAASGEDAPAVREIDEWSAKRPERALGTR